MGNVEFGFEERAVRCEREDCRVKKVYSINTRIRPLMCEYSGTVCGACVEANTIIIFTERAAQEDAESIERGVLTCLRRCDFDLLSEDVC